MPWKRINGSSYYYRHVKRGGKVRSLYVGSGEHAELVAKLDRLSTQDRREDAAAWREEREAATRDDRIRATRFAAVGTVARVALEAAGFHQHNRGEWRRRMGTEIAKRQGPTMPGTREQCSDAIAKAFAGDASALPMLGEMFEADPATMLAVANVSMAYQIQEGAVSRIAGGCLFTREALPRQVEAMRRELAGPRPSPIERLLADRAALSWLDTLDWDMRNSRSEGLTAPQEEHLDRMRGRAIRRLLAALKALAQVRKIAVVAPQANIGERQISLAEAGGPSA